MMLDKYSPCAHILIVFILCPIFCSIHLLPYSALDRLNGFPLRATLILCFYLDVQRVSLYLIYCTPFKFLLKQELLIFS